VCTEQKSSGSGTAVYLTPFVVVWGLVCYNCGPVLIFPPYWLGYATRTNSSYYYYYYYTAIIVIVIDRTRTKSRLCRSLYIHPRNTVWDYRRSGLALTPKRLWRGRGKKLTSHSVRQRPVGVCGVSDGGARDFFSLLLCSSALLTFFFCGYLYYA